MVVVWRGLRFRPRAEARDQAALDGGGSASKRRLRSQQTQQRRMSRQNDCRRPLRADGWRSILHRGTAPTFSQDVRISSGVGAPGWSRELLHVEEPRQIRY